MRKLTKFTNTTCRCKWDLDYPKEQTNIQSNVPLDLPVCNAKAPCKHAREEGRRPVLVRSDDPGSAYPRPARLIRHLFEHGIAFASVAHMC